MGYKYKVDHEYFDEIDTEYKAYILGLIYADGSVSQPKGNRQMKLAIALQEEDGYIMEKFAQDACGGQQKVQNPPSVAKMGWKKRSVVTVTSDRIGLKLISYGCNINKSRVGMKFPPLRNDLVRHFVRGFLDGDGSIINQEIRYNYKRKTNQIRRGGHIQRRKLRIAFCSTDKAFLQEVAKQIRVRKIYMGEKPRTQMIYILWIEGQEDTRLAIDYMYSDANYFLKRKYDKVIEFNKTIKSQAEGIPFEGLETTCEV